MISCGKNVFQEGTFKNNQNQFENFEQGETEMKGNNVIETTGKKGLLIQKDTVTEKAKQTNKKN